MIVAGVLLTAVNFWFTDQVLPDSNAKLRNLLINIQRKKPTLELREQVINEIPPSGSFLRASRIDAGTGRLRSVTIYDMAGTDSRRIIYADSGKMGFTDQGTNLQLELWHGSIHAFKQSDPAMVQVTDFLTNTILVRDVSNQLDLEANDGVRGDREMGTCEMMEVVQAAEYEVDLAQQRRAESAERDLRALLALPAGPAATRPGRPRPVAYCRAFAALGRTLGTAKVDSAAQPTEATSKMIGADDQPGAADTVVRNDVPPASTLRGVYVPPPPAPGVRRPQAITSWAEVSSALDEIKSSELRADQYLVEVHKKWAISVACLVFALVGIPMALRFPRGGMGLVIGGGLAVFAIYYVGLIAGEGLGNNDIVDPWVAMWAPNLIFGALGLFGMYRVSRESGSTRGGDLGELWENLTSRFRRRKAA
jgi:lipopolysaccharide export system permease protein